MVKHLVLFLLVISSLYAEKPSSFIESAIEKTIQTVASSAHVGVEVALLGQENSFYKRNEDKRYIPGSSLKLFTAAAAIDILGIDYRFETAIVADGNIDGGILEGNCFLVAGGDPSFSISGLENLVLQMKAKGIEKIKGDLILDLTIFDDVELGPGWMWDEEPAYWCSPLSALNIEHNCVVFSVKPSSRVGTSCSIQVFPECEGINVINHSQTTAKREGIIVHRLSDGSFEITGGLDAGGEGAAYKMPVVTPSLYVANVLQSLLKKHHIAFEGSVNRGEAPEKGEKLGNHYSEPLSEILKPVLKNSDNLYADVIFKKIGQTRFGKPGSWEKGGRAVQGFLEKKVGLDTTNLVIVDGCGLSRYNLVSPSQMITFLKWVHQDLPEFKELLAIGGVDGLLKKRMKSPYLQGKVRAKSGTMTGVSGLCGFIKGKEEMAFVIFSNGYVKKGREIKGKLEDEVCHVLVSSGL